jgi:hypothetical protein
VNTVKHFTYLEGDETRIANEVFEKICCRLGTQTLFVGREPSVLLVPVEKN